MKLKCPKCDTEHDVEIGPHVTLLCVGCRVPFTDRERREQRAWMRSKHAKTIAERRRKRKVLRRFKNTGRHASPKASCR
jgi:hypothetical protein